MSEKLNRSTILLRSLRAEQPHNKHLSPNWRDRQAETEYHTYWDRHTQEEASMGSSGVGRTYPVIDE